MPITTHDPAIKRYPVPKVKMAPAGEPCAGCGKVPAGDDWDVCSVYYKDKWHHRVLHAPGHKGAEQCRTAFAKKVAAAQAAATQETSH